MLNNLETNQPRSFNRGNFQSRNFYRGPSRGGFQPRGFQRGSPYRGDFQRGNFQRGNFQRGNFQSGNFTRGNFQSRGTTIQNSENRGSFTRGQAFGNNRFSNRGSPTSSTGSRIGYFRNREDFCYFHQMFGRDARNCREPCSWQNRPPRGRSSSLPPNNTSNANHQENSRPGSAASTLGDANSLN